MPTREEIVDWLMTAGCLAYDQSTSHEKGAIEQEKWNQRAAQVESMRCGECAEWKEFYLQYPNHMEKGFDCAFRINNNRDPDFGCWHWRAKG